MKSHLSFKRMAVAVQTAGYLDCSQAPFCIFRGRGGPPAASITANKRGAFFFSSLARHCQLKDIRASELEFLNILLWDWEHRCSHSSLSCFKTISTIRLDSILHFMTAWAIVSQFPLHRANATERRDMGTCRVTGFLYITVICIHGMKSCCNKSVCLTTVAAEPAPPMPYLHWYASIFEWNSAGNWDTRTAACTGGRG